MKANVQGAIERARAPHVAFARHQMRAEVEKEVMKLVDQHEGKRRAELEAYALALDETLAYTLHKELGWGRRRIRRLWEAMYRNRIEARMFFRDGSTAYVEQETGKNIEDLGIRAELTKIGIDMPAWMREGFEVPEGVDVGKGGGA